MNDVKIFQKCVTLSGMNVYTFVFWNVVNWAEVAKRYEQALTKFYEQLNCDNLKIIKNGK
jgi:hypothetical protein